MALTCVACFPLSQSSDTEFTYEATFQAEAKDFVGKLRSGVSACGDTRVGVIVVLPSVVLFSELTRVAQ